MQYDSYTTHCFPVHVAGISLKVTYYFRNVYTKNIVVGDFPHGAARRCVSVCHLLCQAARLMTTRTYISYRMWVQYAVLYHTTYVVHHSTGPVNSKRRRPRNDYITY